MEQIVHELRKPDMLIGQGLTVPKVIRRLEIDSNPILNKRLSVQLIQ